MKNLAELNQNKYFKLLLWVSFGLVLYYLMRQYINICEIGKTVMKPISLKTFLDDWAPFNIHIVWPYVAALFYVPLAGILYAFNPKISGVKIIAFYISVISIFLISYFIYAIFPTTASEVMINSYEAKSQIFVSPEAFEKLQILYYSKHPVTEFLRLNMTPLIFMCQNLDTFYRSSTPLGDFPSVHVSPLVFMGIFLYKNWRSLFWIFLPFAFLGGIGTFIVKFHTVIGFLGGIGMGFFGYYVLYKKVFYRYLNNLLMEEERITKDLN